jgi:hypothetical protein
MTISKLGSLPPRYCITPLRCFMIVPKLYLNNSSTRRYCLSIVASYVISVVYTIGTPSNENRVCYARNTKTCQSASREPRPNGTPFPAKMIIGLTELLVPKQRTFSYDVSKAGQFFRKEWIGVLNSKIQLIRDDTGHNPKAK